MFTCDECADLLLDFVYGLLEPDEVQRLRDHLANCASCQGALTQAQAQQGLLARAAHVAREVPAFTAPSETGIKESIAPTPVRAALPSTGDVSTLALFPPRPRPLRRWPWLATAAALLLLVGGLYLSYERGLAHRQRDLAQAEMAVEAVDARSVSVAQAYDEHRARLPALVQAREVRIQVTGPAIYQREAPGQLHIVTQDAWGKPAKAHLQVEVQNGADKKTVFVDSSGAAAVVLPAGLRVKAGEQAQLVVKATTKLGGEAKLREALAGAGPDYDTHLVLNKPIYRTGEVMFFRTLTLDRFNLKAPGSEIPLTFTLRDARNAVVKQLQGKARPDGIGGGEVALLGLAAGADYTLEVTATTVPGGVPGRVRPRACKFAIVRDEPTAFAGAGGFGGYNTSANQFYFDRSVYAPGDKVRGEFRQAPNAGRNQAIQLNARQANGQAIPLEGAPAGQPLKTVTDDQGKATFGLQLPKDVGKGAPVVEAEVADGKAGLRYKQDIPLAPAYPAVEFFPEGGDLTAGVPNRVYYLSFTPQGTAAKLQGRVLDRQGKEVARVQPAPDKEKAGQDGIGFFTFTPQADESYTLQIPLSPKTTKVLPLPSVRGGGVALSVPQAVNREGEPIRAFVRGTAAAPRLLVLAMCRGQVVDQQFVDASQAGTEVRLSPVPGTRGVVRVTAYEVQQEQLLPRAERLVYQIPTQRLALSCADATGKVRRTYRPGEAVNLSLKAVDEMGKLASATFLACAVDERVLRPGQPEQGPPAFFYLTADVQGGEDLENADILVSDAPQARAALDLFLGTKGWRRFSEAPLGAMLAKTKDLGGKTAVAEGPAVFSRDNFDEVITQQSQALVRAREELEGRELRERSALQEEKSQRTAAVAVATSALGEYQELLPRVLRMAAGVGVLFLLALGGVLLLAGFIQTLRGRRPTPVFAGAFAALLLCLAIFGATGDWRHGGFDGDNIVLRGATQEQKPPAPPKLAPAADVGRDRKSPERSTPIGRFGEPREQKRALGDLELASQTRVAGAAAPEQMKAEELLRRAAVADLLAKAKTSEAKANLRSFGGFKGDGNKRPADLAKGGSQKPATAAPPLAPASASMPAAPTGKKALDPAAGPSTPTRSKQSGPASSEAAAKTAVVLTKAAATLVLREYAYRESGIRGTASPDTVLWYPALLAPDGTARVAFDLSGQPTTYRVLLYAHTLSGRLGAYWGQIETRK